MDLILHRKTQYFDVVRPYRVYVDETFKGKLSNGETKLFAVEDGKHTVEIKQSFSLFGSRKYEIDEDGVSQIALAVSLSLTGVIANVGVFALLLFIIVINAFSLNLGGALFYALPVYLAFLLVAFFGFANCYLTIKPTGKDILLFNRE